MIRSYTIAMGICLLSILAACGKAADSNESLRGEFLRQVRQTGAMCESVSVSAECKITIDYASVSSSRKALMEKLGRSAKATISVFQWVIQGERALEQGERPGNVHYVMATNGDYAFSIRRASADMPYSLEWLEQLGVDNKADQRVAYHVLSAKANVLGSWYVVEKSLSDLIDSPVFEIKRVSSVRSANEELVRVDFEHVVDDPDKALESFTDAFITCDPSRHWALREYAVTERNTRVHAVIEYGSPTGGFPIPKNVTIACSDPNNPGTVRRITRAIDVKRRDKIADTEFYLSHYGLPEPVFASYWLGRVVWYSVGGIICVVMSWVLFMRRKVPGAR